MNCKHFKRRSKNYKYYFYCTKKKKEITFDDCKGCNLKEYKERKPIKVSKPIKKVSKKRVTVTKHTYEYVYTRDGGKCVLCYSNQQLQLHHINGRSKTLTNDVNNCVMLCNNCHHNVVHQNNKHWRPILNNYIANKKT